MRWRPCSFLAVLVMASAHGADIGGWMEHKSRLEAQQRDDCAEIIATASRTPREAEGAAAGYYASGLCYLVSDRIGRDTVAAQAWLARAAELEHPLARRALLSLREPGTAPALHAPGYHCHELGLGRRLCHGGAVPQ
jgi:TPR repeat protein